LQPDLEVSKLVIYRMGSLGDTVVALPCFHLIARTFPRAERVLLTNFPAHVKAPAAAAVLGDSGLVQGYMRYTSGTRHLGEMLGLAWRIRRFKPDLLIYLADLRPWKVVRRDRLFFRLAGVRRIVGIPGEEQIKARFDASTGFFETEASRISRQLSELGDVHAEERANWSLGLTTAERASADANLGLLKDQPLMVCGPGTKMQAKDWGRDNWRSLLGVLHRKYPEMGLALIGAPEEFAICEHAGGEWTGAKVNLAGRLTPRESAAVLEHADVFLGPDSGPMHVAASLGVPCAIAYSARGIPGAWFPFGEQHEIVYHRTSCAGCRLDTCTVEGRRCLTSITVDEMAEAVARILDGRTSRGRTDSALTTSPGA